MAETPAHPASEPSAPHHTPAADESIARLGRDSLTSLATSFGFFAVTYVTTVVFARILSPERFGDYSIGMTTLALGSMAALAGSGQAMTRYLPDYLARQDFARLAGYIRFFVPLVVVAALVIGAAVWIARAAATGFGYTSEAVALHPISVAAVVIGFYALATLGNRLLRSFGFVLASFVPTRLLAPLAALAIVLALYAAGFAITDWLVVAAVGIGFVLAILFELVVFVSRGHHRLLAHKPTYEINTWLGAALPMMTASLLAEVMHHSDLVMIELIATDEKLVGHYAAINNTVVALSIIIASVTTVVSSMIGAAVGRRDAPRLQALLGDGTTIVFLGCGLGTLLIILFREPLLGLFGTSFTSAATALTIAAIAYGVSAAFGLSRTYLQYLGFHRSALFPMAIGILVNIVLNALLIPPLGINGAATATLVSLFITRGSQVVLLYRATGLLVLPFCRRQTGRATRLGFGHPDAATSR